MPYDEATMLAGLALLAGSPIAGVRTEADLRALVGIQSPVTPPPDRVIQQAIAAGQAQICSAVSDGFSRHLPAQVGRLTAGQTQIAKAVSDGFSRHLPTQVSRIVRAMPGTVQGPVDPKVYFRDLWHLLYYCERELTALAGDPTTTLRDLDALFDRLRRGSTGAVALVFTDVQKRIHSHAILRVIGWDERMPLRPLTLGEATRLRATALEYQEFDKLFAPVLPTTDTLADTLKARWQQLRLCLVIEESLWSQM